MRLMRAGLDRDLAWHGECLFQHRNGTDIQVWLSTSRIRDASGEVAGTIGIARDIRERRSTEAELRENEQRFRQVAENLPQALFVRSTDPPQVLFVSPAFERIWGRPPQDILADYGVLATTIHPEDRERTAAQLPRAATGIAMELEYRILRPPHRRHSFRISS